MAGERPLSGVLARLFADWASAGIRYAVVRNDARGPALVADAVDVVVHRDDLARARALVERAAGAHGCRCATRARRGGHVTHHLVPATSNGNRDGIVLDVRPDVRWLRARAGALWDRACATLRPPGHLVVLLGPDGSGKTTTAELVTQRLARTGIPVTAIYLGAQMPLLPTRRLSQRLRRRFARPGAVPVVKDVTRRQRLRGLLHVLADKWLRYLVYVRPRLVRGDVVVLDRYFYDLRTYQHPLVRRRWVEALVMRLIPRPALAFCLTANPSVIAVRKGELTVAETARQLECYRGVGSWLDNFYEVPADGDLSSVVGWMNEQVIRLYSGSPPEEAGTACTLAHMSAAAH